MLGCMIIGLLLGLGFCESTTDRCDKKCQGVVSVSNRFPDVGGDTRISCTNMPRQCLNKSNAERIYFVHHFFSRHEAGPQTRVIPPKRLQRQGRGQVELLLQNVTFADTGNYSCHLADTLFNYHDNCLAEESLGKLDIKCGGVVTPTRSVFSYGASVVFTCNIDTRCLSDEFKVDDLYFTHHDTPVPQTLTSVTSINSTGYLLTNITFRDEGYYLCFLNTSSADVKQKYFVGHQILDIDYGPTSPTDHHCISYNFHSLNCTFIYPLVHVRNGQKFSATYSMNHQSLHGEGTLHCTERNGITNHTVIDCALANMVIAEQPYIIFFNSSHADLGEKITRYSIIANPSIVKLNAVRNLRITNVAGSAVTLSWLPPKGENFKDAVATRLLTLDYNITWRSEWGTFNSQVTTNSKLEEILFNLTSLVPYTSYTISVKIKPQESEYWSDQAIVEGQTDAEVPAVSPLIPPGGFTYLHCDGSGCATLRLYWQDIPPQLRYGKIECYEVMFEGGNSVRVEPTKYHYDINLRDVSGRTVQLSIKNNVGLSRNTTIFDVGERTPEKSMPDFNVGVERLSSQELLVLWNLPESAMDTFLYICKIDDKDRVCASPLHFIANPIGSLNSTIDVKARYGYSTNNVKVGFGYATTTVDGERHYSGITWHCVLSGPIVPKAPTAKSSENELINGLPKVTITWSPLGCDGSSERVESYVVDICEIANYQGSRHNFSVAATGTEITTPLFGRLYPRTVYDVYVTAVTRYKIGETPTDFQRHRFKTKSVDLRVLVDGDNTGTANVSFSPVTYLNDTFVTATLKHKRLLGRVLRPKHGDSVVVFKVKCDSGRSVNMVFRLFAATPGGGRRQLSDDVSVEMCRGKPLSTVLLVAITFSCVFIGGLLVGLSIWICRGVQKEKRAMKENAITIPGTEDCPVGGLNVKEEDEDYREKEDDGEEDSGQPLISSGHRGDSGRHLMDSGLHGDDGSHLTDSRLRGDSDSGYCKVSMTEDTDQFDESGGAMSPAPVDDTPRVVLDKNGYVPQSVLSQRAADLLEQRENSPGPIGVEPSTQQAAVPLGNWKDSCNSGPIYYKPVKIFEMPDKLSLPDEGYCKYSQQDASQSVSQA